MNSFLNYLIEATIGIVLFLLIYRLFLKNETNFSFRRYYLLASLAISIGFPLITISGTSSLPTLSEVIPVYWLPELTVGNASTNQVAESSSFSAWTIIFFLYLTGVLVFTTKLFLELFQLFRLSKKASQHNGIIEVEIDIVAFSFFQFIFIGNATTLSAIDKSKIIDHEKVHQRLGHSYDNLAIELIRILFWYNPLIHQYKKEICTVHEFQADEHAVHDKHDIQTYCNLLARVALKSADFSLANHFNNSLTLKRITMINTTKQKLQWWKQAAMIPIAVSFFFLVACQDQIMEEIKDATKTASVATEIPLLVKARLTELQNQNPAKKYEVLRFEEADYGKMRKLEKQNNTASYFEVIKIHDTDFEKTGASQSYLILEKNSETNQLAEVTKTDDDIFLVVEETAMPLDGIEAYYSKIASEMSYPAEARSKGISGKVFVEFVIEKDGTISDMKVLKGIGEGCDEEAMRVIKQAGLWNPGKQKGVPVRQRMVMPINFSLGN